MSAFTGNDLHALMIWSEACDMQKFIEKYSRRVMPCFVRIAEGYAGGDESQSQFAQNEVINWLIIGYTVDIVLVMEETRYGVRSDSVDVASRIRPDDERIISASVLIVVLKYIT